MNRAEILGELGAQGMDRMGYLDALDGFFRSPYAERRTATRGIAEFLGSMPSSYAVSLVTTARYNTMASVRDALARAGIVHVGPVFVASDEERVGVLVNNGVNCYFDDKPDHLTTAARVGLLTVQVNDARYKNRSEHVDFFYENWDEARRSLRTIINAVHARCSR